MIMIEKMRKGDMRCSGRKKEPIKIVIAMLVTGKNAIAICNASLEVFLYLMRLKLHFIGWSNCGHLQPLLSPIFHVVLTF